MRKFKMSIKSPKFTFENFQKRLQYPCCDVLKTSLSAFVQLPWIAGLVATCFLFFCLFSRTPAREKSAKGVQMQLFKRPLKRHFKNIRSSLQITRYSTQKLYIFLKTHCFPNNFVLISLMATLFSQACAFCDSASFDVSQDVKTQF